MRFSILLPTRNRLELLKLAVQSVLDQDFQDWEIVISDNASEEDIEGFAAQLADPRVKYVRSETFLPVTENWNLSLENSSGDYIVMLGDDDCLMRGALSAANVLLIDHDDPDVLYSDAVLFAYPNVIPGSEGAYVFFVYAEFLHGQTQPFWLSNEQALHVVQESLSFRFVYPYNMQYLIFSRRAFERLRSKGPFFQSPYPDYYASNALFLTAERVLVHPQPLVAIGISPKSYGYYHFNDREAEGVDFLRNIAEERLIDRVRSVLVPGTDMNNSWLLAMEALVMNYGADYSIDTVVRNYRFEQFRESFNHMRPISRFVRTVWEFGTWGERLFWYAFLGYAAIPKVFGRRVTERIRQRTLDAINPARPQRQDSRRRDVPYRDILEMVHEEDAQSLLADGGAGRT